MSTIPSSNPRRGKFRGSHLRQVSNDTGDSPLHSRPLTAASTTPSEATNIRSDFISSKPEVERRCNIWVHDEAFSKDEVVLNLDLFPDVKPGELMAIVALKSDTGARDFQEKGQNDADNFASANSRDRSSSNPKSPVPVTGDNKHDLDLGKRYLFVAKDMLKDLKIKNPGLEISVSKFIADVFCFKHRSNVLLALVSTTLLH